MKKLGLTILFACALFGAGCSDSAVETAGATATPASEPTLNLTEEERAALKETKASEAASMQAAVAAEEPLAVRPALPSPTPTAAP